MSVAFSTIAVLFIITVLIWFIAFLASPFYSIYECSIIKLNKSVTNFSVVYNTTSHVYNYVEPIQHINFATDIKNQDFYDRRFNKTKFECIAVMPDSFEPDTVIFTYDVKLLNPDHSLYYKSFYIFLILSIIIVFCSFIDFHKIKIMCCKLQRSHNYEVVQAEEAEEVEVKLST